MLLAEDVALREIVGRLLQADWSPEQISGWLKRQQARGSAAQTKKLMAC